jgi:hypothetical protein
MGCSSKQQSNIEQTRDRIIILITQCITDIQQTVTSSGLEMRDIGVGIERYQTAAGSDIIELKLQLQKGL